MGRRTPHNTKPPKADYGHFREFSETRNPAPTDLDSSLAWYLVYCRPRMEAKAAKGLAEAGCKVFWPSLHRIITLRRRKTEHDVATYPRYLFAAGLPTIKRDSYLVGEDGKTVLTINGRPLSDIRDIDGVHDVVRSAIGWARVPGRVIDMVAAYQNNALPEFRRIDLRRQPGARVRINSGPFMSFQATVVEAMGLDEAEVLIDIFGRETPARLPVDHLDAA